MSAVLTAYAVVGEKEKCKLPKRKHLRILLDRVDNTLKTIKAVWMLDFMSKVYVDSNVFIAVILGDFGKSFEFMDYKSQDFFDKVTSCHYEIVISDVVIKEIKNKTYLNDEELRKFLSPFSHKLTIINVTELIFEKAKQLNRNMKTGVSDCIHYLISREYDDIVTWNIKHFPNGKKPSEM